MLAWNPLPPPTPPTHPSPSFKVEGHQSNNNDIAHQCLIRRLFAWLLFLLEDEHWT